MKFTRTLTSLAAVLFLVYGQAEAAIGPIGELHIVNAVVAPDGFKRSAVTVSGATTGPLIRGNKGDNFQINVINDLTDESMDTSTSIHWHGLFQKGTNYADGPVFVTQCPILPGNSFLYDFDVPDQAGTFWYHSHFSNQYCDGLRGPMVIYDPNDPHKDLYDVDDESTVLTLSDWYHLSSHDYYIGLSDADLLNGLGRWTLGGPTKLAVITVKKGTRYRFRLVNLACDPDFQFKIDDHTLKVIEADGVSHVPVDVDQLDIFAGQRYSFVLNADQDIGNYWIRFNPSLGPQGFLGGVNSAILRYEGATITDPTSVNITQKILAETDLVPLENPGAPGTPGRGNADINIELDFTFLLNFFVNGVSYAEPSVPVLLQLLSGASAPEELLPEGSIYYLERNKVVEVTMPGGVLGGGHPLHLHGHTFDVIRSAGSLEDNYENPARRDVVNIGSVGDLVTFRFTTDNPGPWFLHCHVDWHFNLGFAIVFAETPDAWAAEIHPTGAWDELCPLYEAAQSQRKRTL